VTSFIDGTQFVILDVLTFTFSIAKPVVVYKLSPLQGIASGVLSSGGRKAIA
jgi:hypothetical protein